MKRIVLITSGQPSLNPRLVKEADILADAGHQVTVLYKYWNDWGTKNDLDLLKSKKWKAIKVGGEPNKRRLKYLMSRLSFKFYNYLAKKFFFKNNIAENTLGRSLKQYLKTAKKINADLYIAHNLAALPIAVITSKIKNVKCGFDAEDFHRNETSDDPNNFQVKLNTFIEDKYLKHVDYITCASPLIADQYKMLYPFLNPVVINNVFELKQQPKLNLNTSRELSLFWFSQTIGKNRGLEDVIMALNQINNPLITLHLLGNLSINDNNYFKSLAKFNINYYKPIANHQLFEFAGNFDVGLALEPGFCLNNKIALSNKLFTYLISGLAIISSNTKAQQAFMDENDNIGFLYKTSDIDQLKSCIKTLFENKKQLNDFKQNAYHLAQSKFNWEKEGKQFISLIEKTLYN